jgi:hypothetical protein
MFNKNRRKKNKTIEEKKIVSIVCNLINPIALKIAIVVPINLIYY